MELGSTLLERALYNIDAASSSNVKLPQGIVIKPCQSKPVTPKGMGHSLDHMSLTELSKHQRRCLTVKEEELDEEGFDSSDCEDGEYLESEQAAYRNNVVCFVCCEVFQTFASLRHHLQDSHGKEVVDDPCSLCPICFRPFCSEEELDAHVLRKHPNTPIGSVECPKCSRVFKSFGQFRKHLRMHTDVRPFSCQICDKSFPWSANLRAHMRTHSGVDKRECQLCGIVCSSSSSLRKHERSHSNDVRYRCPKCGKGFVTSEPFKIHIRQHLDEKPFVCGMCDKRFHSRSSCLRHVKGHSDVNLLECQVCGKGFKSKTSLNRHIPIHDPDKAFVCRICGQKCSTKYNMKQHYLNIHNKSITLNEIENDGRNIATSHE